jgi:hypothetical protein
MWSTTLLLMTGFAGGMIFIILAEIAFLVLMSRMEGDVGLKTESPASPTFPGPPYRPPESIRRQYLAPGDWGSPPGHPAPDPYYRHNVRSPDQAPSSAPSSTSHWSSEWL